jgi:hypothetical protein
MTELGDGKELGAVYMAVLPLGCSVPMVVLKLQFTATGVPLGPLAVNACDPPKASTAEAGETVRPGAGVGVGPAVLEWPPPQATSPSNRASAQEPLSIFIIRSTVVEPTSG